MTTDGFSADGVSDLVTRKRSRWDRRKFMKSLGAVGLGGSAGLIGDDLRPAAADHPQKPPASA